MNRPWEQVSAVQQTEGCEQTDRLKVDGGWLYRTRCFPFGNAGRGLPPSVALVFVPEPNEGENVHFGGYLGDNLGDVHPADFAPRSPDRT